MIEYCLLYSAPVIIVGTFSILRAFQTRASRPRAAQLVILGISSYMVGTFCHYTLNLEVLPRIYEARSCNAAWVSTIDVIVNLAFSAIYSVCIFVLAQAG